MSQPIQPHRPTQIVFFSILVLAFVGIVIGVIHHGEHSTPAPTPSVAPVTEVYRDGTATVSKHRDEQGNWYATKQYDDGRTAYCTVSDSGSLVC